MGKHTIEATAYSTASRERVWRLVSDVSGWSRWGGWSETKLEREGSPPPDGVGAIRVLTSETRRPIVSREEVTAYEPPWRFGYKLLSSGLPLRNYQASITLEEGRGGGTNITWRSEFDAKVLGTGRFFRRALGKFIQDTAERLAQEAERGH